MSILGAFWSALQAIGGITISKHFKWTGYRNPKGELLDMPPTYKWFKPEEVEGLDEEFVAKLDQARNLAGFPFVIASGFRTPEKNESIIGAVRDSSHLKGLAVDLVVANDHEVSLIV